MTNHRTRLHEHSPADRAPGDRFFARLVHDQQGAALMGIIISIIVIASIGTAILSMTTTAGRVQIGSVDSLNGFFLADAGKNFALQYINAEMEANGDPDSGTIPLLNNKTFSFPGTTGTFSLTLAHSNCPGTDCAYTLVSTGMPNGESARELTFTIRPY